MEAFLKCMKSQELIEKRKKSWLLNSPSGEAKCNAMQKKELSFSDSFPAIILCFQVSPSSQVSLGNRTFGVFPGKTQHCLQKILLSPCPHSSSQKQQVEGRMSRAPVLLGAYPK